MNWRFGCSSTPRKRSIRRRVCHPTSLRSGEYADGGLRPRCLLARRLVERGVRFVQMYSGGGPLVTQWDAHDDINRNHETMCGHVDQPVAALFRI